MMVGESTTTETWFGTIWKHSRKSMSWEPEKPTLGILAFEVSRLMSKVVNLWQCLTDKQIGRLREEIANSVGIRKLVSEDENYLMDLVLLEIIESFGSVAKAVCLLGKKCVDPMYRDLGGVFNDPCDIDPKWYGWRYRLKKMEKKVKKMEKFLAVTEQLYQEIEVLAEMEQSLRRMRAGADLGQVKLLEFQHKVIWQRQEVKNLREMSPWVRTYDYTARLLLRSLFTISERIKLVYGINKNGNVERCNDYMNSHSDNHFRSTSFSAVSEASVYPSENKFSVPLGRSFSNLGFGCEKSKSKNKKSHDRSSSTILCGKQQQTKTKRFPVGFTGCMAAGTESPVVKSYTTSCGSSFRSNGASHEDPVGMKGAGPLPTLYSIITNSKKSIVRSRRYLLNNPPSTLGYAALALRYANVIILIEKLAQSPRLISLDARDDLYNMLPATIRSSLRAKLRMFPKTLPSSVYDAAFAAECTESILEWLSPLAHNMIRWQSERNFERQRLVYGPQVLLVQTLHFANQTETEAAMVELLMCLNYLCRFGREVNESTFVEAPSRRAYDGYSLPRDNIYNQMIDHTT